MAQLYHLAPGEYVPAAPNYGYSGDADPAERDTLSWAVPVEANPQGHADTLTPEQVQHWHNHRYLVVNGIWLAELIAEEVAQLEEFFPTPTSWEHAAELKAREGAPGPGGFPFGPQMSAANQATLHPRALRAVSQLLGTDELLLTQSGAGAKYGAGGHEMPRVQGEGFGEVGDQPLHKDFGNNTLLVPSIDTAPEAVCCILFLTPTVEGNGGGTGVVPHTPGIYDIDAGAHINFMGPHTRYTLPRGNGDQPGNEPRYTRFSMDTCTRWILMDFVLRNDDLFTYNRDLYAKEKLVKYVQGTALLYRLDTWHRGSAVGAGGVRRNHSFVWRAASASHVQYGGPWYGASPDFLKTLSPHQRTCTSNQSICSN